MDKLAASLFAPSTAPYFASFRPLCDKSLCCDEVNLPSFLSSSSSYHLPISEQRSTTPRTSPKARRKKRTPSLTREESEECPPFDCCCSMNGIVPVVPPPDCEECVHHCEEACAVKLTPQCTDQCVVVACNDPHPIASSGPDSALDPPCDLLCTDVTDCSGLDEWFCCSEYHPPFPTDRSFSDSNDIHNSSFSWDPNLDPMLANANPSGFQGHSQFMNSMFHPGNSTSHAPEFPHTSNSFLPTSDSFNSPSAASAQTSSYGSSSISTPMVSSTLSPEQQNPLQCMWGNCGVIFSNMSELVGHVNLQHLRIPSSGGAGKPQNRAHGDPFAPSDQQKTISDTLACLWADCHLYPTPNSVPGPSTGNPVNNALGVLASHLLQDHLGLAASPSPSTPPLWEPQPVSQSQGTLATPSESTSSSTLSVSGPPTPTPEHDCSAPNAHVCGWVGCGQSFPSCDDLTAHINAAHVGGGKAHYDCHWTGCGRNGENGFSSKQKICRHLQSHTGHRPFQCKTCKQNFSEAATLAQHMRRHTQEKPYVCDFPGCGKSFAITGALTIHKRTHNGQKPFKCTYCDRAFAESSNLSKHLRTHTGARPYPCTHPGCTKCFARPDQLGRHMSVHRKKITIIPSDGGSGSTNASHARAHTQEVVAGVGGSAN